MIDGRVKGAQLTVLHRGVYAVGHTQLRREGRRLAAVFAAGPGAVLSHRDAGAGWGLRPCSRSRIEVTAPHKRRQRPGLQIHRATLAPHDITEKDAIPITTPARTLFDLASVIPPDHLTRAVTEAERRKLLDTTPLYELFERYPRRPGARALKAALERNDRLGLTVTRSTLEIAFAELLDDAGLESPRLNSMIEDLEVDAQWPALGLVAELDSWGFHRTRADQQADRERSRRLPWPVSGCCASPTPT